MRFFSENVLASCCFARISLFLCSGYASKPHSFLNYVLACKFASKRNFYPGFFGKCLPECFPQCVCFIQRRRLIAWRPFAIRMPTETLLTSSPPSRFFAANSPGDHCPRRRLPFMRDHCESNRLVRTVRAGPQALCCIRLVYPFLHRGGGVEKASSEGGNCIRCVAKCARPLLFRSSRCFSYVRKLS